MISQSAGIKSDSLLFAKLQKYRKEFFNLISRRKQND